MSAIAHCHFSCSYTDSYRNLRHSDKIVFRQIYSVKCWQYSRIRWNTTNFIWYFVFHFEACTFEFNLLTLCAVYMFTLSHLLNSSRMDEEFIVIYSLFHWLKSLYSITRKNFISLYFNVLSVIWVTCDLRQNRISYWEEDFPRMKEENSEYFFSIRNNAFNSILIEFITLLKDHELIKNWERLWVPGRQKKP